ncbi:MAG: hypothetical protein AB1798_21180, partial [Spirochaetota bacterium]
PQEFDRDLKLFQKYEEDGITPNDSRDRKRLELVGKLLYNEKWLEVKDKIQEGASAIKAGRSYSLLQSSTLDRLDSPCERCQNRATCTKPCKKLNALISEEIKDIFYRGKDSEMNTENIFEREQAKNYMRNNKNLP